jgi:RNA polymerase sigma-70 factor (ECF subfamily)
MTMTTTITQPIKPIAKILTFEWVTTDLARLATTDFDRIEDKRGWLIVVGSRICLDQIGSDHSRREQVHESSTIELAGSPTSQSLSVDPADRVTLDEEVKLAPLVVLQMLKPSERVVFVLHDVFGLPFGTIEQFIQACSNGDVAGLLALLDPGVSGGVDLGPADRRSGQVIQGPQRVARTLLRYFGAWTTLVPNPLGGRSVVLAFVERRLYGVILLSLSDERIREIHVIAGPEKLGFLSDQLALSAIDDDL